MKQNKKQKTGKKLLFIIKLLCFSLTFLDGAVMVVTYGSWIYNFLPVTCDN